MPNRRKFTLFAFFALAIILGCRAADAVLETRAGATLVAVGISSNQSPATLTATATLTTTAPAALSIPAATEQPPELQAATETEAASQDELLLETETPPEVQLVMPTATPRRLATPARPATPTRFAIPTGFPTLRFVMPTAAATPTSVRTRTPFYTPTATTSPYKYRMVVARPCEPDPGNTIIEGTVYANGQPENGILVRLSLKEGDYQAPGFDTFVSGTDPINPGQPDLQHPGRYYYQIRAGSPQEGNWWVFVIDKLGTSGKQISQAAFVHTNDTAVAGNCTHAYIDFVRP